MERAVKSSFVRLLLSAASLLTVTTTTVSAQNCDPHVRRQMARHPQQPLRVLVDCSHPRETARTIAADGHRATVVGRNLLSAYVPADYAQRLSLLPGVRYVQTPRQARTSMSTARPLAGVDRIHDGTELETPYTGQGVIIGIIDQGFEYKHVAFLDADGQSRVRAVWNRTGYKDGNDGEPTTDIPATGDQMGDIGHATFVTNVAAGSRISENDFYGVAPDAELVMIPSSLDEAEVLEDVQYISQMAAAEQKPWVVNMSFGTQLGAHDGQSYFDQALCDVLTAAPGRQIVAATGNDHQTPIHVQHTFAEGQETVRLLVAPVVYKGTRVSLWSQSADSLRHLTVAPYYLRDSGPDYATPDHWAERVSEQIAPFNRKQNVSLELFADDVTDLQTSLGIEVSGQAGQTFDAWIESDGGAFTSAPGDDYLPADNRYCVSEMGASVREGIAVGAYVSTPYYTPLGSTTPTDWGIGQAGDMSTFSNGGPLIDGTQKPDIAAPGGVIVSAYSKVGSEWSPSFNTITHTVRRGIRTYYYGASYGTSFATPIVTGTIALWLQANPRLTNRQIQDILHQTATRDAFTGDAAWSPRWGYGKLNAYEGLREALRLGSQSGIAATRAATEPLTLFRSGREWRLLFGSNESEATVGIYRLDGTLVATQRYTSLLCGDERILRLDGLAAGTYLVSISTARARLTRKLAIGQRP